MRARAALAPTAAVTLALAGGCDWRAFDDQADQAPVLNLGAPSHFGASDDFGRVVAPVAPPTGGAARYLVSATTAPALAMVDLDPAGKSKGQSLDFPIVSEGGGGSPVTALGASPDGTLVLMGAPGNGRVYKMELGATTTVTLLASSTTETGLGLGVAIAPLAGQAAPELIVASLAGLHVYLDGNGTAPPLDFASSPACPIALVDGIAVDQARPVVVVGSVLAVGTPLTTSGTVSLFQVGTAGVTCLGTIAGGEGQFGRSMAVGDFDADGNPDLLVGSPPRTAFLFKGPLAAGAAPVAPPITYPDSGGGFGVAVAAGNVDGKAGVEALIADTAATVSGKEQAGAVVVYSGPALATRRMVLSAHNPGTAQAYGTSVSVLPFCNQPPCTAAGSGTSLALVGSITRTFTYFKLEADGTDPRER